MSQTSLDLANAALIKVGAPPLTNLFDGSKSARICAQRFQASANITLEKHPWDGATTRVTLAPRTDIVPDSDYSYYSALPANYLRLLQCGTEDYPIDDYEIEGNNIASNQTVLPIKYIFSMSDFTPLSSLLFDAIACQLAMDIAYAITQDHDVRKEMSDLLQDALREAKSKNAKEGPPQEVGANDLIYSRINGVYITGGPIR